MLGTARPSLALPEKPVRNVLGEPNCDGTLESLCKQPIMGAHRAMKQLAKPIAVALRDKIMRKPQSRQPQKTGNYSSILEDDG